MSQFARIASSPEHDEQVRVARALGINTKEAAPDSVTIAPLGAGFVVRWQGVKFMSGAELRAALEPPRQEAAPRDWDRVHNRPADIYTPPEDRVPRPVSERGE